MVVVGVGLGHYMQGDWRLLPKATYLGGASMLSSFIPFYNLMPFDLCAFLSAFFPLRSNHRGLKGLFPASKGSNLGANRDWTAFPVRLRKASPSQCFECWFSSPFHAVLHLQR